jgi:hypothetical protein
MQQRHAASQFESGPRIGRPTGRKLQGQPEAGLGTAALDQEGHHPVGASHSPIKVLEALYRLVVGLQDHILGTEASVRGGESGSTKATKIRLVGAV